MKYLRGRDYGQKYAATAKMGYTVRILLEPVIVYVCARGPGQNNFKKIENWDKKVDRVGFQIATSKLRIKNNCPCQLGYPRRPSFILDHYFSPSDRPKHAQQ